MRLPEAGRMSSAAPVLRRGKAFPVAALSILLCLALSASSCGSRAGQGTASQPGGDSGWQVCLGSPASEKGYCVRQALDGGFVILGDRSQPGSDKTDFYLVRTDDRGTPLWERTYGGEGYERGYSVALTSDGGYLLVGDTDSFGSGLCDVFLVKTDAEGNELWHEAYGGSGYDWAYSVLETGDGGFLLAGETESFGSPAGIYLLRTDAGGKMLWQKKVNLEGISLAQDLEPAPGGGYVLCGWMIQPGRKDMDFCLVKVDEAGNLLWHRAFGGEGEDWASCVRALPGGGYALAGATTSMGAGKYDAWLGLVDEQGNLLREETFGKEGDDYAHGACVLDGKGLAVAGSTWSASSGQDMYLLVADGEGNPLREWTFGGDGEDWAYSIILADDGSLVLAGMNSSRPAAGEDVFLVKVTGWED